MNIKKIVYIILTIILGQLIALFIYEISLVEYIKIKLYQNITTGNFFVIFYDQANTHVFWTFIASGSLVGLLLGLRWWRMVYVEHKTWQNTLKS